MVKILKNLQLIESRIKNVMAVVFKITASDIKDTDSVDTIELWDSLKHMELIVSIEQEFEIELSLDEIVAMQNVGEIKRIVYDKVGG